MNTRRTGPRYTSRLTILITPEQRAILEERAFRSKVSVGELARDALFPQGTHQEHSANATLEQRVSALEREINLLRDRINSNPG